MNGTTYVIERNETEHTNHNSIKNRRLHISFRRLDAIRRAGWKREQGQ